MRRCFGPLDKALFTGFSTWIKHGRRATLAAVAVALLAPYQAQAQVNSTCSVSGSTATCSDVPSAGIRYTSGVDTVVVNDPTPTGSAVNISNATVGVFLSADGTSGTSGIASPTLSTVTVTNDNGTTNDTSDDYDETLLVVQSSGARVQDNAGNDVRVEVQNGVQVYVDAVTDQVITEADLTDFSDTYGNASLGSPGGAVNLDNNADLTTTGANGVVGQSKGGDGGNGGVVNLLLVSFGKDGKDAQNGQSVVVTNSGDVTVNGATTDTVGILALSQGGEGGDGGGSFGLIVSDAGAGGDGGDGAAVYVGTTASSNIVTTGEAGHGIYAKSSGGDGGRGGSGAGAVALGSKGGQGGVGGTVEVVNAGSITTSGDYAHGIYGFSLGAGSGSGSSSAGLVAVGGGGGGNADSDTVTISNTGNIQTGGVQAYAILAQSIGGGGGDGGSAGGIFGSVGGSGGSGGDASTVIVCQGGTYNSTTGQCTGAASGSVVKTTGEKSAAIIAQSIGGGGGTGGDAVSAGPVGSVAVGGNGGLGGLAGEVHVTANGTLTTTGSGEAYGILAQSIGGGGGQGGRAIAASIGTGVSVSVALGGDGGTGNSGDDVYVDSTANISTLGDRAAGISAQSIGGGGGAGGLSVAATLSQGASAAVSVGGSGGTGGDGQAVTVNPTSGSITTSGTSAHGVFAQSVGGGGGSGGLAVAASASISGNINVGLGGTGAAGGDAGTVTLNSGAEIETGGIGAYGLYAQSIGGGGGDGGTSVAAGLSATASIAVGVGGTGGGGGTGSLVNVDNEGNVTTTADQSTAILAQSVGGGGGAGGNALTFAGAGGIVAGAVTVGLGGEGSDGGAGGEVQLDNTTGAITTSGANSTALLAQSIGGGGGAGGFAVAGSLAVSKDGSIGVSVALGGGGGAGGTSDVVTVNNAGTIVTGADYANGTISDGSSGIVAQSIAGGGGAGGTSVAASLSFSKGGAASVGVSLGGDGGSGGIADAVTVDNDGSITTRGADSFGILAQSVGGAGGAGGLSVGATLSGSGSGSGSVSVALGGSGGAGSEGKSVTIDNSNTISTDGARAVGIAGQSIGGAGGAGGTSVAGALNFAKGSGIAVGVGLGGLGGDGGSASLVDIDNTGAITTAGADAAGILGQSIGGQGGLGGLNVSGAINASQSAGGSVSVGLGGAGGSGGTSGDVDIFNSGAITTTEARAGGIIAQSIGGEGGQGGLSISFAAGISKDAAGAVSVSLGGSGGGGGTAGGVTVTNSGAIATSGSSNTNVDGERVNTDAHAILAQSIGGSGGIGGVGGSAAIAVGQQKSGSVSVAVGGQGGDGGTAGTVYVDNSGNLSTGGDNSIGLVAQSIGGGGGAGGAAASLSFAFSQQSNSGSVGVAVGGGGGAGVSADTVDVLSSGNIATTGESAFGILAQSIGGDGGQGGFTVAATGTVSREVSGAVGVSVGGAGGTGGTAGDVNVGGVAGLSGNISTQGENASAVVAQSIGGGGGSGGFAGSLTGVINQGKNKRTLALGVTVGGFGGDGGAAGAVDVSTASDAVISTQGDFAYGILAQSIGGKGGNGGGALGAVINSATGGNSSLNASITVGGFGGDGAKASTVNVANAGAIYTGDPSEAFAGQFAHGILAQSIGGDGGSGGFSGSIAFAVGASNQSGNNYNLSTSVGGFGGTGADASTVTVSNTGSVVTYGERARGIFAQSVGGGGGAGGDTGLGDDVWGENFLLDTAVSKIASGNFSELDLGAGGAYAGGYGANSHSLAASVGGFGGAGGDGGLVDVDNDGTIITFGTKGHAIFAQSVGGGGGQGGISTSATAAAAASNSTSISLAVGGFGGAAGDGGDVDVDNSGDIITVYHGAYGVFAQSVGGGGGDGGDTRGFTLQRKDTSLGKNVKPGKQLTVTVGGFGGAGGDSGVVDVDNDGNILTFGTGSVGIFAQTVGGGGGTGGNSSVSNKELSALFENDSTVKKQFLSQKYKLALGGFGGKGGIGREVTVTNRGSITTVGEQATGIYAQSVGGGGGTGGKASTGFSGDLSIGGFGGVGNDGGQVVIANTGAITTTDNLADGIFAQSVGGGGGDGGAADFGDARSARGELIKAIRKDGFKDGLKGFAKKLFLPTFGIGVGGFGGASGDGGEVVVCNGANSDGAGGCSGSFSGATISTTGNASHGIFAQSVGGGGGAGGQAYLTNVGKIGIGGLGGAAGDGGTVTVVNNGSIYTQGYGAYGVFAQSVGGGGGLAGDITFGIENFGKDESKLVRGLVQYTDASQVPGIDLDGDGTVSSAETTASQELFGFGTNALDESLDIDSNGLPISDELAAQFVALYDQNTGADPMAFSPADPLNGQSTSSLDGAVSAALLAALDTAGIDMKDAITAGLKAAYPGLATEIDNLTGSQVLEFLQKAFTTDGTSITLNTGEVFDLLNGITGDGGAVSVTTTGNIVVTGGTSADSEERAGSIGIFAQSVGGGGGIVGNTVEVTEAEIGVDLNLDGDTDDTFDVSDGSAFAGTVGGKGKGGTVYVKHTGSILSPSWNGYGIFAQSTGGDGGSNISIDVDGGTIQGGENEGAAILIDGGDANTLTIGEDSYIYSVNDRAIISGDEDETVSNSGTVVGDVDLGKGTNSFANESTAIFESRTTIGLNGGAFTNAGTFNVSGSGSAGRTRLAGSFQQTGSGQYVVDLNFGARSSDVLRVTGNADLAGKVVPNLLTFSRRAPAELVLLSLGGLTDSGIDVQDTAVIDYGVVFDGNEFKIEILDVDFGLGGGGGGGLTPNEEEVGEFLNTIVNGDGSASLGEFFAYLANLQDPSLIPDILERLHAEPYAALLTPTLYSSQRFGNEMQSCPVAGDVSAIINEGQCIWARFSAGSFDKEETADYNGIQETTQRFTAGAQLALSPNWRLGGALEFEQADSNVSDLSTAELERFSFGGVLKFQKDDWILTAAASGGVATHDVTRYLNLTDIVSYADQAFADVDVRYANVQARAAHLFNLGRGAYIKPIVDLNAFYLDVEDFNEGGVGALNLQIRNSNEWVLAATPSLEIGGQFTAPLTGTQFRPYLRGGVSFYNKDLLGVNATFEGAPASAGTFFSGTELDDIVANVTAGLDVVDPAHGVDVRLRYDGRFSENVETHAGSLRVGLQF